MPLTAAEREFLGREWAWDVRETSAVKTRYPGAREADRESPWRTAAGPAIVNPVMHELLDDDNQLYRVVLRGIVDIGGFFEVTPNATLHFNRFGLEDGRTMIVERVDHDYQHNRTTLWLYG